MQTIIPKPANILEIECPKCKRLHLMILSRKTSHIVMLTQGQHKDIEWVSNQLNIPVSTLKEDRIFGCWCGEIIELDI